MTGTLTPGEWLVRAVMVLGPVAALLATAPAGALPRFWLVALVLGLSVAWAVLPESALGTGALAAVVIWWGVALRDGLVPEAVPAAFVLVAAHVAGVLAAYGPPELPVDPAVARLWLWRGALVFVTAPGLWLLAWALRDQPEQPGVWITALVATVAAAVVAGLAVGTVEDAP